MNVPRNNTFYAFCSLLLPGLGQLLQKRPREAVGFFSLFLLSGFLPVLIVCLLFMDRFSYQPIRVHVLHLAVFGGLYLVFLLTIFWSVIDAVKPKEIQVKNQEEKPKVPARQHSTFLKLMTAVVIIGLLITLLMPGIPSAREAARRMQCSNNMRQIVLAFHAYHDQHGCFPPTYTVDEKGQPLQSWRVLILPYVEQKELYEKIRLDEPWDSEYNRQFHTAVPRIYQCPSANSLRETAPVLAKSGSYYSVIDGAEAAFSGSQTKSKLATPHETLVLVERRMPVNWMDPSREISFDVAERGVNVDAMGISSYHPGGVTHVALGDGSLRVIPETIDKGHLRKMLTDAARVENP